jgi:putative DNA primase/helicase
MESNAEDMIRALYKPGDTVCYRVFSDKKGSSFTGAKIEQPMEKFQAVEPLLRKHNAEGRGIFAVINTGGNEDKDIRRINAQFVESDDLPKEEQKKNIDAFPLPPSMIVESEKSLHVYWLMKDGAKVGLFRAVQKALADHFHGDTKIVNPSRVMRLPGFNHCKKDTPYEVHFMEFHPERRYTQEELIAALPEYKEPDPTADGTKEHDIVEGSEPGITNVVCSCEFMKHCHDDADKLPEFLWYGMISNLAMFKGGRDKIHELSAKYPGYTKEETDEKIRHFLQSKTGPITCATLAEKGGWECPKMKDGTCRCKAPAAKGYEPMSMEALEQAVTDLPVTGDMMKDVTAVNTFIHDCLFNVDPAIAAAIFNHKLKDKFHFTVADIRPMAVMQKTLYKEHSANAANKARKASAGKLPAWYTVTDKGVKFLPDILADYLAKNAPVFYAAEQFYRYENGVYNRITDLTAQNMVRSKMISGETKMSQITDATSQWKMVVEKDVRELNPNPYLINVRNGMFDVLKGQLSDHSEKYNSTMQLAVNYDPVAKCPRFMQFLSETLEPDQIPLIQEMLGYCLIPVSRAQKCFVLVGEAAAGKSVLLRVLSDILLGQENVSHVSWQALNERFKPAELFGRLANVFADLPTKNIDDNGIFKSLVGEDKLTVERKNKDPFSFMSTARLIFSCNSIPRNYGDRSEGFYRRLIIVRYNHSIPPEERDPNLVEKLQGEADGIFLYALEGLKRLMGNDYRFTTTETNEKELQKYREDSNSVLAFIKENCELDAGSEVPTMEFYNQYKAYCDSCGVTPFAQRRVSDEIAVLFPMITKARDKVGSRRIWKGIKITGDDF